ncbi:MAG: hypothetical protein SGPRY_009703, partial [Prymnesium sp.]
MSVSSLPACVWCSGPILQAVQAAGLFADSKDFVDSPLLVPPSECWRRWTLLPHPPSPASLQRFVASTFGPPGGGLEAWWPPDFREDPPLLSHLSGPERDWARQLHHLWPRLTRRTAPSVLSSPEMTSLLPSPHGFVVPGGRFREAYYWDTYWVVLGLLAVDMRSTARSAVENLLESVATYGFVPNGMRAYYLNRSQPPMLTQMVHVLADDLEATRSGKGGGGGEGGEAGNGGSAGGEVGDCGGKAGGGGAEGDGGCDGEVRSRQLELLRRALPLLDREYRWWMEERVDGSGSPVRLPPVESGGPPAVLNRYAVRCSSPRPESWREDRATVQGLTEAEAARLYSELAAGAQSGWDYSSRWLRRTEQSVNASPAARAHEPEPPDADSQDATDIPAASYKQATHTRASYKQATDTFDASCSQGTGTSASNMQATEDPRPTLQLLQTSDLLPADLNAILYKNERSLATLHSQLATLLPSHPSEAAASRRQAEAYERAANARRNAMRAYLWGPSSGRWHDFLWRSNDRSDELTAASYVPLWAGMASRDEAEAAVASLKASGLIQPGGVATTLIDSGEQWDFPNAWPPLQ